MNNLQRLWAALTRIMPWMKRVDWVGRGDDIKTIAKAVWRAIKWLLVAGASVWAWIMSSAWGAFFVFVGVGLVIVLFGPPITEEWIERRIAKARKEKRDAHDLKKQLPALLPDIEALADGLAKELEGDIPPSTVARNHATMQKVTALLATSQIEAPQIGQPLADTARREQLNEWMAFVVNLVAKIRTEDYEALPTLCRNVQNALQERREANDLENLLQAYHDVEY